MGRRRRSRDRGRGGGCLFGLWDTTKLGGVNALLMEDMDGATALHPAKVIGADRLTASRADSGGELLLGCTIVLLFSLRDVTAISAGDQFSAQGAVALGRHSGIDAVQTKGTVPARGEFNEVSFFPTPDTSLVRPGRRVVRLGRWNSFGFLSSRLRVGAGRPGPAVMSVKLELAGKSL